MISSASLGPASWIGLSPVRANFAIDRRTKERGGFPVLVSLFVSSLFFFARVRLRSFAKDRWRSG